MLRRSEPLPIDPYCFQARPPWWGGDLQTLRNTLVGPPGTLPAKTSSLEVSASDGTGDIYLASLDTPASQPRGPLVVLIHGLTGCEGSYYVLNTAKHHLTQGRQVLRVNLRGAGPSKKTCQHYYHAGRGEDLDDFLSQLDSRLTERGIYTVGYSLGGNIMLGFLAKFAGRHPLVGAATISSPIIPAQAAKRIMAPRNWLYHRWLLNRMKTDCLALKKGPDKNLRQAIEQSQTVYQFDNDVIAPLNGFKNADDYYEKTASINMLDNIKVPTILIHAQDDPWIPSTPYETLAAKHPGNVSVNLSTGGGHVGFHGAGSNIAWHDQIIEKHLSNESK